MKRITRITSLILAAAMLLGLLPGQCLLPVRAAEAAAEPEVVIEAETLPPVPASGVSEAVLTAQSESTYQYTLDAENNATITGYSGDEADLLIPAELDGYPVTAIGSNAFKSNKSIETLTVPEGVTSIGTGAFKSCTNLKTAELPASLLTLGANTAYYQASSDGVFEGCTKLEQVTLKSGLTLVGDRAFYGCAALKEMILPDTLVAVGEKAFNGTTFESIHIPASLTTAHHNGTPRYAYDCPFAGSGVKYVTFEDGITTVPGQLFRNANKVESVVFPDSVTTIGYHAFDGCTALTAIEWSENLEYIDAGAFSYCSRLVETELPASLQKMGVVDTNAGGVFEGCSSLARITLNDGLTVLGQATFSGCAALEGILLPDTLAELGENAFRDTTFESIHIPASLTKAYIDNPYYVPQNCPFENSGVKYVTFAEGTETVAESLFQNAPNVQWVVFPDSVTKIDAHAFSGCRSLTTIDWSDNLIEIGQGAFASCTSLTEVDLPDSLQTLGWHHTGAEYSYAGVFDNCTALKRVDLSDGLISIGDAVFNGCAALEKMILPGTLVALGEKAFTGTTFESIHIPASLTTAYYNTRSYSATDGPFMGSGVKYVTFEDGITTVPSYLFRGAIKVESIELPDSVTRIGQYAFSHCDSLTDIKWSENLEIIGAGGFAYCLSLKKTELPDSLRELGYSGTTGVFHGCTALEHITLNEGLTVLGDAAFSECAALKEIKLPSTLEIIGKTVFQGTTFESIQIPASLYYVMNSASYTPFENSAVKYVTFEEGTTTIPDYLFKNAVNLKSVVFPEALTKIGAYAFSGCTALGAIDLPDNLAEIGAGAFYGCTSLGEVELPASMRVLGTNASYGSSSANGVFQNCTALEHVELNEGLTYIGDRTFSGCAGLDEMLLPSTLELLGELAFEGTGFESIVIPASLTTVCYNWHSTPYDGPFEGSSVKCAVLEDGIQVIPRGLFCYAANLEYVIVPASVTMIGIGAFLACPALTDLYFAAGSARWNKLQINSANDALDNVKIHYNSTGPAVEYSFGSTNNISYGDFGDHELQLKGSVSGSAPYTLTVDVTNKSKKWTLFMSQAEISARTLEDIRLVIELPDGITAAGYGTSGYAFNLDQIALGTTLRCELKLDVEDRSSTSIKLTAYSGGKQIIRQSIPVVWPTETTQTILPNGNVNSDMASRAGLIEISSGSYGKKIKVTQGQNVSVPAGAAVSADELIVEGSLVIRGSLTAKKVTVKKNGTLTVVGSLTAQDRITVDSGTPKLENQGVLSAAKAEVSQGSFLMSGGTAEIGTLTVNYGGSLNQTGGNLIISGNMEVSASDTSTLTGGTLWLYGNFKQSWHSGNFQASGAHAAIRMNKWDGTETKFSGKDAYFNHFYVEQSAAGGSVPAEVKNYTDHIRGSFCQVSVNAANRSFSVLANTNLDGQQEWEKSIQKAYAAESQTMTALESAVLSKYLSQNEYKALKRAVATWMVTAGAPAFEQELSQIDHVVDYMELEFEDAYIVVYTKSMKTSFADLSTLYWYGRFDKANYEVDRDNAQAWGGSVSFNTDAFTKGVRKHLTESAIDECTTMLGAAAVKKFAPFVSGLVEFGLDSWGLVSDVADNQIPNVACDYTASEEDLPALSGKRTVSVKNEAQPQAAETLVVPEVQSAAVLTMTASGASTAVLTAGDTAAEDVTQEDANQEPIVFTDEGLAALLRVAMGKTPGYAITHADALEITCLNLSSYAIYSLDGLEAFVNLTSLNLSGNNFHDLTPISGLTKLQELNISGNRIVDLSALSGLTNLTTLLLADNPLTDISVLEKLTQLTNLDLSGCGLTDFSALQALTGLETLDISGMSMPGGDLTVLSGQTALRSLTADRCELTSLDGLAGTALETLCARYNQLTTLGALDTGSLTAAMLEGNQLTDISALSGAVLLTTLNLGGNALTDEAAAALAGAGGLQQLDVKSNQLTAVAFAADLPALVRLDAGTNPLTDLSGAANHAALTVLCLDNCSLTDAQSEQLKGLTALQQLQMRGNGLTSAAFLAELPALEYADLSGNAIDADTLPESLTAAVSIASTPVGVKTLELEAAETTLLVGDSIQVACYVYPALAAGREITWTSSDPAVAAVSDSGKVQAVSAGTVTIEAVSANGKTAAVTLTIREPEIVAEGWSGYTTWDLLENGKLVFSGQGAMRNYTNKTAMPWYEYFGQITSVVIEEGVTGIGNYAFYGMDITSIEIPDSVTSIGSYAFKKAGKLDNVKLPAGLTQLGESAFYACTSLTAIDIPGSLWTVQPYTFKNCTALTSVTFHEGNLQKISDGAFYNTALTEVVLPDCLDILDGYVFKNCAGLAKVTLGGGLTEIREAVLYGTAIAEIAIPEGVTVIGPYAFKNCGNLAAVSLPASLISVGEAAFYGCTVLPEVEIPEGVTAIGAYAFKKCTNLTKVSLPEGLTVIGDSAFHTCRGLSSIVIPASVERIGEYCFSGSWKLWQITFRGDAPAIGAGAFRGIKAQAYYPDGNSTWTDSVCVHYGGYIKWIAQ